MDVLTVTCRPEDGGVHMHLYVTIIEPQRLTLQNLSYLHSLYAENI